MAVTQANLDVIRFAAAGDSVANTFLAVQKFVWVGPTDATHKLILKDSAGTVLLEWLCGAAGLNATIDIGYFIKSARFYGLVVDTMGSGKLDVYLE